MGLQPSASETSTDLCQACGLCCQGPLFSSVLIEEDEVEGAREAGLTLHRDEKGAPRFDLPCSKFCAAGCSIYEQRPRPCRSFQCKVLQAFEKGEISFSEATELVGKTKAMIAEVSDQFADGDRTVRPARWQRLLEEWQADALKGDADAAKGRLVLDLARLNRFLDLHFRNDEQQVVRKKSPA